MKEAIEEKGIEDSELDDDETEQEENETEDTEDETPEAESGTEKEKVATLEFQPDIMILITGTDGIGKGVIKDIIAKRLRSRPLGYSVYEEMSNALVKSFNRISGSDIQGEPEWDERVRRVLLKTEISENEMEMTAEEEELQTLGQFLAQTFPDRPEVEADGKPVQVAISVMRSLVHDLESLEAQLEDVESREEDEEYGDEPESMYQEDEEEEEE